MPDQPGSNAIDVRSVRKVFGAGEYAVTALDTVSVSIRENEFFTLLGPSGCGKTTLLRLIAGFEYPSEGEILLYGKDIAGLPPHKRPVNTVFQSYALFPHMTVAENIAFGLEMLGRPKDEIKARVAEMLALVRMENLANRRTSQISGGQQQRVALARALAPQPKVLLLDEPLSALDYKLRKGMQIELKRLQHETGITFIFVTHDQEEALTMSDRIAVMNAGKVLQVGTPTEIYERPNCRFVADFIGEANFLSGRVRAVERSGTSNGLVTTLETGDGLTLRAQGNVQLASGSEAVVSIRPEKAFLSVHEPAPGTANCFRVTVEQVAYIGSDTRIIVRLGSERLFDVWEQNSRSTLDRNEYWQPGESGYLWWPAENALVLTE